MPTVKSFRKSQILGIKLSLSMFILFCIFKSYHQNQFTINYNIIMRNPNTQTSKKDPSHLNHWSLLFDYFYVKVNCFVIKTVSHLDVEQSIRSTESSSIYKSKSRCGNRLYCVWSPLKALYTVPLLLLLILDKGCKDILFGDELNRKGETVKGLSNV